MPDAETIISTLLDRGARTPDGLAFTAAGEPITWGALRADVRRWAAALAARGVRAGDTCAIPLPTSLDFLRAFFAAQALRAVPVAVNTSLPPETIARRVALVGARVVVALPGLLSAGTGGALGLDPAEVAREARAPLPEEFAHGRPTGADLAYLQLTSGTTGEPRAAAISHRSLMAYLRASTMPGDGSASVFCGWLPLHHDLGLVNFVFSAVHWGCPSYILEPSIAKLGAWLETCARVRATDTAAPDFAYRIAARIPMPAGLDLRSLRVAWNGGEPVRLATIEAFERRFGIVGVVRPGYGLAEATLAVVRVRQGEPLRTDARGNVSNGRPVSCFEVRIADDGEILVRGEPVFDGYFRDEAATAAVLEGGWLHTGDLGSLDEDGQLTIVGRRRAVLKRGGAMVSPREAEEAADSVGGVRASAAVGLQRGLVEELGVLVEAREGLSPGERAQVRAAVSRAIARAVGFPPVKVVMLAPRQIPRTSNGKTRYEEVRRLLESPGTENPDAPK